MRHNAVYVRRRLCVAVCDYYCLQLCVCNINNSYSETYTHTYIIKPLYYQTYNNTNIYNNIADDTEPHAEVFIFQTPVVPLEIKTQRAEIRATCNIRASMTACSAEEIQRSDCKNISFLYLIDNE